MARRGLVRKQSLVYRMRSQLRKDLNIQKRRGGYISNNWLRKNPWRRQFNFNPRNFDPSKHKRVLLAILLIGLSVAMGGWIANPSNGVFHKFVTSPCLKDHLETNLNLPCGDPYTVIYEAKNTPEFNFVHASFAACGSASFNCWKLIPSATMSAVVLSNTSITNMDLAAGKQLLFVMDWINGNNQAPNQFDRWGYYLTTNKTLPTQNNYDPRTDPNVVLTTDLICNSATCPYNSASSYLLETLSLRTLGQKDTIAKENNGGCPGDLSGGSGTSGSCFLSEIASSSFNTNCPNNPSCTPKEIDEELNYTGTTNGQNNCTPEPGNGCSFLADQGGVAGTANFPTLALNTQQYYLGLYGLFNDCAGSGNCTFYFTMAIDPVPSTTSNMFIVAQTPGANTVPVQPQIDTGGFFGPIIKALINIGVFIFNAILGFIAFIVPALEAAFNFLESIIKLVLNGVGIAFGFPASPGLGDDLFNFINAVITLFTVQVPNAFLQITNIFNGWINLLVVVFTTGPIGEIFSLLSDVLNFSVNLVAFAWTVFNLAALTYSIATPWWLFFFAIAFNCDDGVEGWIKTWEFAKWLAFDIGVKTVTWLLNWTIDVVTAAIGFIPKPVIQMASAKFPRIPVIDIHGSFSIPRFDGSALKEGNLFAIFGFPSIVAGLIWYELTQTGIPGTLANLYSTQPWVNTATVAITFYKIFLPIFGLTIFLLMIPTLFNSIFGIRVEGGMPVSLGRRPSGGVVIRGGSGPLIRRSQKHLQGRLLAKISAREKIEKRVRGAVEKEKERLGEKATQAKAQAELAKKELGRKPSGRDIKGPRLGPLDQE